MLQEEFETRMQARGLTFPFIENVYPAFESVYNVVTESKDAFCDSVLEMGGYPAIRRLSSQLNLVEELSGKGLPLPDIYRIITTY